jgi:hypothetical protein
MPDDRLKAGRLAAALLLVIMAVPACRERKSPPPPPQETPAAREIPRPVPCPEDEIARFLAGIPVDSSSALASRTRSASWKRYSASTDSAWAACRARFDSIREWAGAEFEDPDTLGQVFYPFSGPDFIHIHALYPDAERYTLFGLEPVGCVPDLSRVPPDSLETVFNALTRDLDDLMSLTFFKTRNMRTELADRTIQGILPLLMYFISRTGNTITSVKPFVIDKAGETAVCDTFVSVPGKRIFSRGVEIGFMKNDSARRQTLIFISADVSNGGFLSNPGPEKWLEKMPGKQATFIKAASYLMHQRYFSAIRRIILAKSASILQDDSGIPFRFYDSPEWTVTLYGTYAGPVRLFKNYPDADLKKAYAARNADSLDIRFGYQAEPNLLWAVKNR